MSGSVSVANGRHAEHFLCWIFGFFINLFFIFVQVPHKLCCAPVPPLSEILGARAPASSMAPAPMRTCFARERPWFDMPRLQFFYLFFISLLGTQNDWATAIAEFLVLNIHLWKIPRNPSLGRWRSLKITLFDTPPMTSYWYRPANWPAPSFWVSNLPNPPSRSKPAWSGGSLI